MDLEGAQFIDDRMPGIVAAVEARDKIEVPGEGVDGFSFALIPPLRSENYCDRHAVLLVLNMPCGNARSNYPVKAKVDLWAQPL